MKKTITIQLASFIIFLHIAGIVLLSILAIYSVGVGVRDGSHHPFTNGIYQSLKEFFGWDKYSNGFVKACFTALISLIPIGFFSFAHKSSRQKGKMIQTILLLTFLIIVGKCITSFFSIPFLMTIILLILPSREGIMSRKRRL